MNTFSAIFLGVVQGLTEFLPVSSSGHLVLVQKLIPSFSQPGIVFDVVLHMGTLVAVFIYFRQKILTLTSKYLILLGGGTIPAVLFGFTFRNFFESTFSVGGIFLALQFLVTAILCFLTDSQKGGRSDIKIRDSLVIGSFQALSIFPAVSRSGATIFAGVKRGIKKQEAAEFSFLLSIPAILGANLLELFSYKNQIFPLPISYFLGFLAALSFGLLSIKLTLAFLEKRSFRIFGVYTLLLAAISLFI